MPFNGLLPQRPSILVTTAKKFNSILPPPKSTLSRMNRAVFLDRDGTLIAEKNYLHRPEEVEIFPGAAAALKKLTLADYQLIIVTNQSGIGRGYFTLADAEQVNAHLAAEFARDGVHFAKTYIAPEAPEQPSYGRKPYALVPVRRPG